MLKDVCLDTVSICTPTATHEVILKQGLDAGVRAIWCEKPLGRDVLPLQRRVAQAVDIDTSEDYARVTTMVEVNVRADMRTREGQ